MGIEATRRMALHCALKPDLLLVRHVSGSERLGACFEYIVTLYSHDPNVEAEALLGQHATVSVRCGQQPERFFDGIVCEFAQTGHTGRYWTYRMVLRPWLWLLSRNSNCRIFQGQTTLEIAHSLFETQSSSLESNLMYTLAAREYCVQYHESDLSFLTRLFEDDGIYFFFKHKLGAHTLVLVDSTNALSQVPEYETLNFRQRVSTDKKEGTSIYTWVSSRRVQPGHVSLADYDFKKPNADLSASSSHEQSYEHAGDAEVYAYPGGYTEVAKGQDRARVRMEAIAARYDTSDGVTDAAGLFAGALFTLKQHPRDANNRTYQITAMSCDADSGAFESGSDGALRFEAHVQAIPDDVAFRPQRSTPRPVLPGAQTATVVGPKESEIWTDEYGRVKLQFHWDRKGKCNESSSCWVRVAQVWTGSSWGAQHIPRVGQEVVVEFLDGDPDHPLITGCVYNEANRPPFQLPKHQTQSGVKTRSTPNGGHDEFNELRFEDQKGHEHVHLQAQRDLSMHVKNNSSASVGGNCTRQVAKNQSVEIAEGYHHTTVKNGEMRSTVSDTYAVEAKSIEQVATDAITFRVQDVTLHIDGQSITLMVGQSTRIKLDLASLLILGPRVDINPAAVPPVTPIQLSSAAMEAGPQRGPDDAQAQE